MKVYCDSSLVETCFVIEGEEPVYIAYDKAETVNVGEYWAVITALNHIVARYPSEPVELLTDSQLVANQVTKHYSCRAAHLIPLLQTVWYLLELAHRLHLSVVVCWIPREENIAGKLLEYR